MVNFCLALFRQFLLDPSPVSNPVSCAGATIYKFDINWITKKIYIKNIPTSDTFSDPVHRESYRQFCQDKWQGHKLQGRNKEWGLRAVGIP